MLNNKSSKKKNPSVIGLGDQCCGCGACSASCPKSCISMVVDETGFSRPCFVSDGCIGCGICDSVCPALNPLPAAKPIEVSWAKSVSSEVLDLSSSGGVFGVLANDVLNEGGVVVGAAFGDSCRRVEHECVSDMEGLHRLQRSKYVQSAMPISLYKKVKLHLESGSRVFFTGTACQVAGIRNYLGALADSDSFLSADVICHGVPSPLLWEKWLDFLIAKRGEDVVEVNFRSKKTGWSTYSVLYRTCTERGQLHEFGGKSGDDWYMRAFLDNASIRPSCFQCSAKGCCGSDLTLGDFWGFPLIHPEIESEDGVSAVVCNTEKGRRFFCGASSELKVGPSSYDEVLAGNPALSDSAIPNADREEFMKALADGETIEMLSSKWTFKDGIFVRMKRKIKRMLKQ